MQIKNTYTPITEHGDTSDIIKTVMWAYDIEDDNQIKQLAYELQGEDDLETCHNIWKFLLENIQYKADKGTQEVRTPAKLINSKTGDCKSYSILTGSVLRYLEIPHFFRFTGHTKTEAEHVYIGSLVEIFRRNNAPATPSQNDINNMFPNPERDGLFGSGASGGGITTMPGGGVQQAGGALLWLLPLALVGGLMFNKGKKKGKKKGRK